MRKITSCAIAVVSRSFALKYIFPNKTIFFLFLLTLYCIIFHIIQVLYVFQNTCTLFISVKKLKKLSFYFYIFQKYAKHMHIIREFANDSVPIFGRKHVAALGCYCFIAKRSLTNPTMLLQHQHVIAAICFKCWHM